MDIDGELLGTQPIPGVGAIAARNDSDWLMARGGSQLTFASLSSQGVYQERGFVTDDAGFPGVATSGSRTGIVYEDQGVVRWIQANASRQLDASSALLTDEGYRPAITGTSEGFAIAWGTTEGLAVAHYDANPRATICGPTTLAFGNGIVDAADELAMADTPFGFLVLALDAGTQTFELLRFGHDCSLLDRVEIAGGESGTQIDLAAGGGHVGATWVGEVAPGKAGTMFRAFPDLLCE